MAIKRALASNMYRYKPLDPSDVCSIAQLLDITPATDLRYHCDQLAKWKIIFPLVQEAFIQLYSVWGGAGKLAPACPVKKKKLEW